MLLFCENGNVNQLRIIWSIYNNNLSFYDVKSFWRTLTLLCHCFLYQFRFRIDDITMNELLRVWNANISNTYRAMIGQFLMTLRAHLIWISTFILFEWHDGCFIRNGNYLPFASSWISPLVQTVHLCCVFLFCLSSFCILCAILTLGLWFLQCHLTFL